jgi:hypothetical protein
MSRNRLVNNLGEAINPHGIMAQIQAEFNELYARIESLEKQLRAMNPGNPDVINDIEFLYSLGQMEPVAAVGRSYTAAQVKTPDEQRMSIEKFKEAFGRKVVSEGIAGGPGAIIAEEVCKPIAWVPGNTEQKKEETHAAHTSSFVLKI